VGVIHIPLAVSTLLEGSDYEHIRSGESLVLPIALGLSLILAGLSDSYLVLSGEKTAWNENWGALLDLPPSVQFGLQGGIELVGRTTRRLHS
jgi:hypothetical protein